MPREQRERSYSMPWTAMETIAVRRSGLGMRQGPGALAARALDAACTMVSTWIRRGAERRELRALDWRMRRDIGLGPCEIGRLAGLPSWRA
jgi:uncharacterized protein YjiS (DUF1127 family)